jgi:hypothetical protein
MATANHIPIPYLHECLDYDEATGVLTWRRRPSEHFVDERIWKTWNTRFAGKAAATDNGNGYLGLHVTYAGVQYKLFVHCVAFALAQDRWPEHEIDHDKGATTDNRLTELREATRCENAQNTRRHSDNTSGVPGVSWDKERGKWAASLMAERRYYHLGRYPDLETAATAYREAKAVLHFQPTPRDYVPPPPPSIDWRKGARVEVRRLLSARQIALFPGRPSYVIRVAFVRTMGGAQ